MHPKMGTILEEDRKEMIDEPLEAREFGSWGNAGFSSNVIMQNQESLQLKK